MLHIGLCKWYDTDKGYGVLVTTDPTSGEPIDIFLHYSNWTEFKRYKGEDIPLVFRIEKRESGHGYQAKSCKRFRCSQEQWEALFECKIKNIVIEKFDHPRNLPQLCLDQIKSLEDVTNFQTALSSWMEDKKDAVTLKDLQDYISARHRVKIDEYRKFIASIGQQFPFDERKVLFTKNEINLDFFSKEECLELIPTFSRFTYLWEQESNPDKVLFIVYNQIKFALSDLTFREFRTGEKTPIHSPKGIGLDYLYNIYKSATDAEQASDLIRWINLEIFDSLNLFEERIAEAKRSSLQEQQSASNDETLDNLYCMWNSVFCLYLSNQFLHTEDTTNAIRKIAAECPCAKSDLVRELYNYTEVLGEDLAFKLSKDYFLKTHDISAILYQIERGMEQYSESLKTLIDSLPQTHPDCIDFDFTDNIVKTYHSEKNFISEDNLIAVLKTLYKNTQQVHDVVHLMEEENFTVREAIEEFLFDQLPTTEYLALWENNEVSYINSTAFNNYFDDNPQKYIKVNFCIGTNQIGFEVLKQSMVQTLDRIKNCFQHRYFKTKFYIFKFLQDRREKLDDLFTVEEVKLFNWFMGEDTKVDWNLICSTFILFPEDMQILGLKHLFKCKACGEFDFKTEDLNSLRNCDQKYLAGDSNNRPQLSMDVEVIIESLNSYITRHKFLVDKDLFRIAYSWANKQNVKLRPIQEFFDLCGGKKYFAFTQNWLNTNKYIFQIIDKNGRKWYIIKFAYNEYLLDAVKAITGRRYHKDFKIWFAPESSVQEVEAFARNNRFLLIGEIFNPNDIDKPLSSLIEGINPIKLQQMNHHLGELRDSKDRSSHQPILCEGSQDQKQKDTYWCVGHTPCNKCCISVHSENEWQSYTLLDFCLILGLDVSSEWKSGYHKYGNYTIYVALINKFNELSSHLYCQECGGILYPVNYNYATTGVTNFCCENKQCSQYKRKVYLSHCFSKKCRNIIDSREAARCSNGWVICKECGLCCSTSNLKLRLDHLIEVGSTHPLDKLKWQIDNNVGHAEHKIYFCYKCGAQLPSDNIKDTICPNCGTNINYTSGK